MIDKNNYAIGKLVEHLEKQVSVNLTIGQCEHIIDLLRAFSDADPGTFYAFVSVDIADKLENQVMRQLDD